MGYGIYTATAGAVARQHQLEVTSNNLANADTDGFRAQVVGFSEALADAEAPNRKMVAIGRTFTSARPGSLKTTNNPMDLSIQGQGFFVVGEDGFLSRSLTLQVSSRGRLQDTQGRDVMGETGPIEVDPTQSLRIDNRGRVLQGGLEIDRIRTVGVVSEMGLQPAGLGVLQVTQESGRAVAMESHVVSGAIESSNVNSLESMVQLIQLQRDYQSLTRAIQSYREADESLIETARG